MSVEAGGSAQLEHDAWDALVALRRVEVRVQALTRATAAAAGGNGDAAPDRERE